MSRKEEILRKAEELRRAEEKIRGGRKDDVPYDGSGMDRERMPLGCWMWIIALVAGLIYILGKTVLK